MAISGWNSMVCSLLDRPTAFHRKFTDIKQLDQVAPAMIPLFLSEYGSTIPEYPGDTHYQPRLFQETKALYSAPMNQTFSGGCVYEFWQARNGFGLVEMLPDSGPSARRAATNRANDQHKVYEKRETSEGTLLIYHDFANYKAGLEATREVESTWNHDQAHATTEPREIDITTRGPLRARRFEVPDSCIDWDEIREGHE
nr:1,3-beta-glucanosyltransferase gel2 [Quercus suber]POE87642.1 1,3-beta-glucanosyltransferase gel2 [Quercus suber]